MFIKVMYPLPYFLYDVEHVVIHDIEISNQAVEILGKITVLLINEPYWRGCGGKG